MHKLIQMNAKERVGKSKSIAVEMTPKKGHLNHHQMDLAQKE
jgi:hypothetical protein